MIFPALTTLALAGSLASAQISFEGTPYNNALSQACVDSHSKPENLTNLWADKQCTLAAVATQARTKPVDLFLAVWFNGTGEDGKAPESINLPLPTEEVLASLAYGEAGAAITEQSWVDAYYASLDDIGGPYPDGDVDLRKYYGNVASWTGNCEGSIPANEFADYVKYSSTVQGTGCGN